MSPVDAEEILAVADEAKLYRELWKRSLSVANATFRVACRLWNFCVKTVLAQANPFAMPELEEVERVEPTLWEPELVITFARACGALGRFSIGDAVVINHWLSQRKGDVPRLAGYALHSWLAIRTGGQTP